MKKIHILHISEFGGHSKAAQNLKEALFYKNSKLDVRTQNCLGYLYPRGEKVLDFIYTITIKHFPQVWRQAYDKKKVIKTLTPTRSLVNRLSFKKLAKLITEYNPDCFVTTQAFPCGLIADYKKKKGSFCLVSSRRFRYR